MPRTAGSPGVGETFRGLSVGGRFVLLGVFVNQLGAFLQLFMVLYLTARGFSAGQAGLAAGGYAVGAVVGNLTGGSLTDRLGPRTTIVAAMAMAALFTLSVTALRSIWVVVPVVALAGAMTQASRPASLALLQTMAPPGRQVMVLALFRTALNAGQVLGPFAAAWLATISWNLVFWSDAATSLAFCLIGLTLLRPARPGTAGPPADGTAADGTAPADQPGSYLAVLRDRRYLAYLLLMLGNGVVYIQLYVVLPLMLKADGYPPWGYSSLLVVSAILLVGLGLPATKITQRWPVYVAVISGWSLMLAGSGLIGLAGGFGVVAAAWVVITVGEVMGGPAAFAHPALAAPAGSAGRYIASAFAVFGAGQAIGPLLGVALYSHLGSAFWAVDLLFGAVLIAPGVWGMRLPPRAGDDMPPVADAAVLPLVAGQGTAAPTVIGQASSAEGDHGRAGP